MKTHVLAQAPSKRSRVTGFTLIELMITVAIVAILATIAYPNYRDYVIRGQVISATNGLTALQANMERFFQDNRQYTDINGFLSPCDAAQLPSITNFRLSCTVPDTDPTDPAPSFLLTATGTGTLNGFTYTVNTKSVEGTSIIAPAPSNWIIACTPGWSMKAQQC